MDARGIRRKVDDLGRVVIPSPIRKALGIVEGDELDVGVEGDRIVMTRASARCVFCGGERHLDQFQGRAVCWSCAAALRAKDRERRGEPPPPRF